MTKSRELGDLAQTVATSLPTALGTAGQTLVVNSAADGLEFGQRLAVALESHRIQLNLALMVLQAVRLTLIT